MWLGDAKGVNPLAQHLQNAVGYGGVSGDGRGVPGLQHNLRAATQIQAETGLLG
jgi:hypothetical protein